MLPRVAKYQFTRFFRTLYPLMFVSAMLHGCGGGGGSTTGSTTGVLPTTAPSAQPESSFSDPAVPQGDAALSLSWDTPTRKVDGSCATNIAGYRVNLGTAPGQPQVDDYRYTNELQCEPSGQTTSCGAVYTCTHTVTGLADGTWYATVQAFDTYGNLSDHSNEVEKFAR